MRRQLVPALVMVVVFTLLCGLAYPLLVTGVAQVLFRHQANGSLVAQDGRPVGSALLGQAFSRPEYFHPRTSAAGDGYDASASSGSNLGPTNPDLLKEITDRVTAYRSENGLAPDAAVPVDAVTASGSGLDPEISVANARLQAARVAGARGVAVEQVLQLVDTHTEGRGLGVLGERGVNVLELNLDLDRMRA